MKRIAQALHRHRDAVVMVVCILAALVAVQINDDRAEGRAAVEVASK